MLGQLRDSIAILAFDHDPNDGLRARGSQHDAAAFTKLGFDVGNRLTDLGPGVRVDLIGNRHAQHRLRQMCRGVRFFI